MSLGGYSHGRNNYSIDFTNDVGEGSVQTQMSPVISAVSESTLYAVAPLTSRNRLWPTLRSTSMSCL